MRFRCISHLVATRGDFSLGTEDVMVIFDRRLAVVEQLERMQRSGRQKPTTAG